MLDLRQSATVQQLISDVGEDAFLMLSEALIAEIQNAQQSLPRYLADKDWHMLEVDAHAMKSAARSFGAEALADACLDLEKYGQSSGTDGDAKAILNTFDTAAVETLNAIKKL
ncbi:hypothetical protein GCM10017044_02910 [Kordiimonas sediminis]|uniref:HPt domain-containing protein n=2 Tax=Kordiimonas sediminis TaxID=1735581 RepID=A0A919AM22_9PROT|nr:hypothetical protein GCM10017044_02910 [Kordiimonas sediminis]